MKRVIISLLLLALIGGVSLGGNAKSSKKKRVKPIELKTRTDSVSYIFGYYLGYMFKQDDLLSLAPYIDPDKIAKAMKQAIDTEISDIFTLDFIYLSNLKEQLDAESMIKALQEEDVFMSANGVKPGVITTESGLQYRVEREGDPEGNRPDYDSEMTIRYMGKLVNNYVFVNNYDSDEPDLFNLNALEEGLQEGLQLMSVGSKYTFYLPFNLAYGEGGDSYREIPPYSTLIYEVELLDTKIDESYYYNYEYQSEDVAREAGDYTQYSGISIVYNHPGWEIISDFMELRRANSITPILFEDRYYTVCNDTLYVLNGESEVVFSLIMSNSEDQSVNNLSFLKPNEKASQKAPSLMSINIYDRENGYYPASLFSLEADGSIKLIGTLPLDLGYDIVDFITLEEVKDGLRFDFRHNSCVNVDYYSSYLRNHPVSLSPEDLYYTYNYKKRSLELGGAVTSLSFYKRELLLESILGPQPELYTTIMMGDINDDRHSDIVYIKRDDSRVRAVLCRDYVATKSLSFPLEGEENFSDPARSADFNITEEGLINIFYFDNDDTFIDNYYKLEGEELVIQPKEQDSDEFFEAPVTSSESEGEYDGLE